MCQCGVAQKDTTWPQKAVGNPWPKRAPPRKTEHGNPVPCRKHTTQRAKHPIFRRNPQPGARAPELRGQGTLEHEPIACASPLQDAGGTLSPSPGHTMKPNLCMHFGRLTEAAGREGWLKGGSPPSRTAVQTRRLSWATSDCSWATMDCCWMLSSHYTRTETGSGGAGGQGG